MVETVGIILGGGRGSRLGNVDKALVDLGGRHLIMHVIERLGGQVEAMAINANGDAGRFGFTGLPVVGDPVHPPVGPLGGVLAGMAWARSTHPDATWLITIACDTPFIPDCIVERLTRIGVDHDIVRAGSVSGIHHLVAAWRIALADELRDAIDRGVRKVAEFTEHYRVATVRFDDQAVDPFLNINTPDDLVRAKAALISLPGPPFPRCNG
jgi:molybdopterin-guanine dinucleotide biosynthesis protein A